MKTQFLIKEIDSKIANQIQIEHHYLHTKASCTQSFGLYENDAIIGVILYGNPTAPTTLNICGDKNKNNVIELTRLWIKDDTPKNIESYFIGNTIKLINKKIIVAFADPDANHIGTVYQASNFYYCGKSKRTGKVIAIRDDTIHNKTLWTRYKTANKIREVYGDRVYYKEYNTKYRYMYINTKNKYFKKELLESLIYDIEVYPKKNILTNDNL